MIKAGRSIHRSKKGTKTSKEPKDWGFHYPNLSDLSLDAAIIWLMGNGSIPPSREDMLDQDPKWLEDVYTNAGLLRFQLDGYPDD